MSQSRDKLHFVSPELHDDEADHCTAEPNNALIYGIVLLIIGAGMIMAFVFMI